MGRNQIALRRLKTIKYFAAIALMILAALYIPLSLSGLIPAEMPAYLVSFISFVLLFMSAKRFLAALPPIILYVWLYALTGSVIFGSIALVVFTSVSLVANEIIMSDKAWKTVLIFVSLPFTVAAAYFMTRSVAMCVAIATPYIIAAILGICIKKKMNRKDVIILLVAAMLFILIATLGAYMLINNVGFNAVKEAYVSARDTFINYVSTFAVEMNGEIIPIFGENQALAADILVEMSNTIPAAIIIVMIVLSYFLYKFQTSMLDKFGGYEFITQEILKIDISAACAATYLIAFIFSFTTDSYGAYPFGAVVCQNIYTVLTPALAYAAVRTVRDFLKKKKLRIGFLLIIPMALLAVLGYLSMALSLIGIICIFGKRARSWADKKE